MLYINELLAFISLHPALAYGTVFLISLSESLALIGLIVPGTVIMFGVGAIVATGSLELKPVLLGRFVGPVRPVIPVVTGMLGMSPLHFSVIVIAGDWHVSQSHEKDLVFYAPPTR